ncbi:protein NLRC3-like [Pelodytes ibericus]
MGVDLYIAPGSVENRFHDDKRVIQLPKNHGNYALQELGASTVLYNRASGLPAITLLTQPEHPSSIPVYVRFAVIITVVLIFLVIIKNGCQSIVINGTIESDVLLPCMINYKSEYNHQDLVVSWQRLENDTVVHSYYYGSSQAVHQDKNYQGRTAMFSELLSKGNMSLLLKNVTKSDAGNYTCIVILNDNMAHTINQQIELYIQGTLVFVGVTKDVAMDGAVRNIFSDLMANWFIQHKNKTAIYSCYFMYFTYFTYSTDFDFEKHMDKEKYGKRNFIKDEFSNKSEYLLPRDLLVKDIYHHDKEDINLFEFNRIINSKYLLKPNNKNLVSKRMLLVGNAGTGKSCLCKWLQTTWARGENLAYKCILYLSFKKLTCNEQYSLNNLLERKCKALSSVLDWNPHDVLLIVDNIDEVFHSEDSTRDSSADCNTVCNISSLVSKIIAKQLIPNTNVLCVLRSDTQCNVDKYFKTAFQIQDFSKLEAKVFHDKLFKKSDYTGNASAKIHDFARIPLYCEMMYNISNSKWNIKILESSSPNEMLIHIMRHCLVKLNDKDLNAATFKPMAKMAYENLIQNQKYVMGNHYSIIMETWCEVLNVCNRDLGHTLLQDILAAMHCVWEIQKGVDIQECLNRWVLADNSKNNNMLLQDFTICHTARFHNFVKFFMRLLVYPDYDSLLYDKPSMNDKVRRSLVEWFQLSLQRDFHEPWHLKHINLLYELNDVQVTKKVSACFKELRFCNTPLNYMDIQALAYSLKNSKLEKLDLRLCALQNVGVTQLKEVIKNAKHVWLSSNNLTHESGYILGDMLKEPECIIEELSMGTNKLGPDGVQPLWKALEQNRSLKFLYLYDNKFGNADTAEIVDSLMKNNTLQELHLCGNKFSKMGYDNLAELKTKKKNMKIVLRIDEDEKLFSHVEKEIQGLYKTYAKYDQDWLSQMLQVIQNDLKNKDYCGYSSIPEKKLNRFHEDINRLKKMMDSPFNPFSCLIKCSCSSKCTMQKLHEGTEIC